MHAWQKKRGLTACFTERAAVTGIAHNNHNKNWNGLSLDSTRALPVCTTSLTAKVIAV